MDRRLRLHRSSRVTRLDRDADEVWSVVAAAGRGPHWYDDALPLVLRGLLDRALGGAGQRWPGPERPTLEAGDRTGFWVVTGAARRTLTLTAAVRAPGRVVLTTSVAPSGSDSGCRVEQSVAFDPDGLAGQLFMLADLPAREVVVELVHRRLLAELRAGLV